MHRLEDVKGIGLSPLSCPQRVYKQRVRSGPQATAWLSVRLFLG